MTEYGVGVRRRRRRRGTLMAKRLQLSNYTMTASSANGTLVGNVTNKITGSTLTLVDDAGGRFKLVGAAVQASTVASTSGTYTVILREDKVNIGNQTTRIEIRVP